MNYDPSCGICQILFDRRAQCAANIHLLSMNLHQALSLVGSLSHPKQYSSFSHPKQFLLAALISLQLAMSASTEDGYSFLQLSLALVEVLKVLVLMIWEMAI